MANNVLYKRTAANAAAIPVHVNIIALRLARDAISACGIVGHFARACKGGTRKQAGNRQRFVDDDTDEEAFVVECKATSRPTKKFFAHLHLVHDGKSKIVRAQIDSASTCNTMPCNLLSQLFPNLKVSKTRSRISTYGSQTIRPKGQVTLVCDRKGSLRQQIFLWWTFRATNHHFLAERMRRLWSIWRFMQTKQRQLTTWFCKLRKHFPHSKC